MQLRANSSRSVARLLHVPSETNMHDLIGLRALRFWQRCVTTEMRRKEVMLGGGEGGWVSSPGEPFEQFVTRQAVCL